MTISAKDVELAEVLTDNDPNVGDVLALYEVAENDENMTDVETRRIDDEPPPQQSSSKNMKTNNRKGGKQTQKRDSKRNDVLKEIRNGGGIKKKPARKRTK